MSVVMSLLSRQNNNLMDKKLKKKMYTLGFGSTALIIIQLIRSPKYRKTAKKFLSVLFNAGLISSSFIFVIFFFIISRKSNQKKTTQALRG